MLSRKQHTKRVWGGESRLERTREWVLAREGERRGIERKSRKLCAEQRIRCIRIPKMSAQLVFDCFLKIHHVVRWGTIWYVVSCVCMTVLYVFDVFGVRHRPYDGISYPQAWYIHSRSHFLSVSLSHKRTPHTVHAYTQMRQTKAI